MTNEEKYKTPEEREEALCAFCNKHIDAEGACTECPAFNNRRTRCSLNWLALEAEEEEPMPCPFCGGVSVSGRWWISGLYYVQCVDCGSMTKNCDTKAEAIAAWNRRVNNG